MRAWTLLWNTYRDAMALLLFLVGMGMAGAIVLIFK